MKPATLGQVGKFVSSSSAASGQNSILAGIKDTKFDKDKAKKERKSPSAERAKVSDAVTDGKANVEATDGEWNLAGHAKVMGLEPGKIEVNTEADDEDMTELERQAHEDKKRHKAAIDGEKADIDEGRGSFDAKLERERSKRLDLEESLDEVKREMGYQREAAARTVHTVGKLVQADLQAAEKQDQITVYVVKKKSEKAKAYFEAFKVLQRTIQKDPCFVCCSNNGPMIAIQIVGPEFVREAVSTVKKWQQTEKIDAAVFKGKSTLTQMLELPVRGAYAAVLEILKTDNAGAKQQGLHTNWLDYERKWSIGLGDKSLLRGRVDLAELQTEIHINLDHFEKDGADKVTASIRAFEQRDRFGSLCEITFMQVSEFKGTNWGRLARRS